MNPVRIPRVGHRSPYRGIYLALVQLMMKVERSWLPALCPAVLLVCAVAGLCAQTGSAVTPAVTPAPSGSLSGRLTNLRSVPLPGVHLVLRNQSTGVEFRATTGRKGEYRFVALVPGAYALQAGSDELGRGEVEDIQVAPGYESRVKVAMQFDPVPRPEPAMAAMPAAAEPRVPAAPPQQFTLPTIITEQRLRAARVEIQPETALGTGELPRQPVRLQGLLSRPAPAVRANFSPPIAAAHSIPAISVPPGNAVPAAAAAAGASAAQVVVAAPGKEPQPNPAEDAASQPGLDAAAVTTTLSGEQLQSLPVSGRRWQELFLDMPSAVSVAGGSELALRGEGQNTAETSVDGARTNLAFGGASGSGPALSAQDPAGDVQAQTGVGRGWSGGHGFAMSSAAIRQVRVVAGNVEAAGAHAAGGSAGVETESGGNQLHGQSFFFDRQNTWGARNPFTQWAQNTGTTAAPVFASIPFTPPDHESSWGVGAGSRILRDRLFWFAALDGYRRNDPGVATARDFANLFAPVEPTTPSIVLLSAQLGESANQAYSDYMGVPRAGIAGAGLEQLAGLLGPAPRAATQWVGFARIDWQAAERHRFALEGTAADWSAPGGGLTRVSESFGNHSFGSSQARQEWLLARWQAFITPNLLAVVQASAGRDVLSARPDVPSGFEQGFLGGDWNGYGQLPQIAVDSRYGFTIGNPSRFGQGSYPDERMIRGQGMVDWVRGKLLVKAGVELEHNTDTTTLLRNQTGTYSYSKVENFIADALVFEKFGPNASTPQNPHNCDTTGKLWHTATGQLMGLGALPCYSYFTQIMGPNLWQVRTNDWASFTTLQWQLNKFAVLSAGLRWEREQLPPPLKLVENPELPLTERLPHLGNQWGPRMSLALGNRGRWPMLRLGYGMYFGRTENATLETALTQTGSLNGDLYFFIRPTDGYTSATGRSNAPLFPHVLDGPPGSIMVPGAVEYAPNFRNSEVHQALASVEQRLPGRIYLTGTAMLSLGRRLPVSIDTNFDPAVNPRTITYNVVDKTGKGPIKTNQLTVPYYALWPARDCAGSAGLTISGQCGRLNSDYQQITEIESRANSTYEAAMLRLTRYGSRGLTVHANYTYAHAMDWNPNESTTVAGSDVLDPAHFEQEYGVSTLDVRHSASAMLIYQAPWKLHGILGRFANGWMISGIGHYRSGLPYSMHTTGAIPRELDIYRDPTIVGIGPGMNGSGGDNRVYGVGRNTFRYPQAWKADVRLGKKFFLGEGREFQLLAESFNIFNHQNVTQIRSAGYEIESGTIGTLPTLTYLTVGTTGADARTPAFGLPFNINATNFYRERQIQLGARLRF